MLMESSAGFREIEHTADWELEVWAPDLPSLLEQAARGMYAMADTRLADGPRRKVELQLCSSDAESLLVAFLSELLYYGEQERLGFDAFELTIQEYCLQGWLHGAPIVSQTKEIKAVTYHKLAIQPTQTGLQVRIVFDV